jgi:hypothetical protein
MEGILQEGGTTAAPVIFPSSSLFTFRIFSVAPISISRPAYSVLFGNPRNPVHKAAASK